MIFFIASCSAKGEAELEYGTAYQKNDYKEMFPRVMADDSVLNIEAEMVVEESLYIDEGTMAKSEAALSSTAGSQRLRTFSGGCTVRTSSPADSIIEAVKIAEKYEGWVESSSDTFVKLRVRAKYFKTAFNDILKLGSVADKYEETADVTDQYADLKGRIDILSQTRDRLATLLAAEKDTARKVSILKEIKRVDDQIDKLQASFETLKTAIAWSVIDVSFIPYNYDYPVPLRGNRAFAWIENLDPFRVSLKNVYRKVVVKLPEDFAILKGRHCYFHGEAADGTVIKIGTVDNNPYGTSNFWCDAVIHRIGMSFKEEPEIGESGEVSWVLFKSKGGDDFYYLTGFLTKRKLLYVVEVLFPNTETYEKRIVGVKEAIEGLKIK